LPRHQHVSLSPIPKCYGRFNALESAHAHEAVDHEGGAIRDLCNGVDYRNRLQVRRNRYEPVLRRYGCGQHDLDLDQTSGEPAGFGCIV